MHDHMVVRVEADRCRGWERTRQLLSLFMLTDLAADSSVDRCHSDRQDKQMIMYHIYTMLGFTYIHTHYIPASILAKGAWPGPLGQAASNSVVIPIHLFEGTPSPRFRQLTQVNPEVCCAI